MEAIPVVSSIIALTILGTGFFADLNRIVQQYRGAKPTLRALAQELRTLELVIEHLPRRSSSSVD